jgi:hypothetical protein
MNRQKHAEAQTGNGHQQLLSMEVESVSITTSYMTQKTRTISPMYHRFSQTRTRWFNAAILAAAVLLG